MSKLRITLACGDYDRTRALAEGTVTPEGVDLNYLQLSPAEIFWRMLRFQEFDASELSTSAYMTERCRENPRFIAIPVFPSRVFRHSFIFINAKAGIKKAEDLKGRKVGVPEYGVTAALWIRGILQHEYGVAPTDMKWYTGGKEGVGRQGWFTGGKDGLGAKKKAEPKGPGGVTLNQVPVEKALSDMIATGELDALVTPMAPISFLKGDPNVVRLFPDFKKVEQQYYKKTKIFPIMHTIVIRRDIFESNLWLAQSLYKAFSESKRVAQDNINKLGGGALPYMLPWSQIEYESTVAAMGEDYWPYGIGPNLPTLEAITQYSYEQGLSDRKLSVTELFAPSTQVIELKAITHK